MQSRLDLQYMCATAKSAICIRTAAMIHCGCRARAARRDALAINPQTTARLRAYLDTAGHGADIDGPLFRPLKQGSDTHLN